MCHFLEPSMELDQNMSYNTEIRHSRCFYGEQYGTVKKWRRYCRYSRKPPSPAEFVLVFLAEFESCKINLYFSKTSAVNGSVSLQFHIVLHKSICYAKFQWCNSYFGRVPCLVPKSGTSALSLLCLLGHYQWRLINQSINSQGKPPQSDAKFLKELTYLLTSSFTKYIPKS